MEEDRRIERLGAAGGLIMGDATRARILCVDDEPNVLEGLKRHLRRQFDVEIATGGPQGIEVLRTVGPVEVVVSDMRMPGMNGAAFLASVRQDFPDTVRLLLTGASDLDSAIAAVNEGQIFRFLAKPCAPEVLLAAVDAAVQQHRLVTAERVLLEQTLHGSIKAMTDLLAIAQPGSFSRAMRARRHVSDLTDHFALESNRWEIEVAAMLSQIGCIAVPPETLKKVSHGLALTEREHEMVERIPLVALKLLSTIPRIEGVKAILRCLNHRFNGSGLPRDAQRGQDLPLGSRLLKLILDFDALEAQGLPAEVAFDTLRGREGWYDPALLEEFARAKGNSAKTADVREIKLLALRAGMVLADDIRTSSGNLVVARGHEITEGLRERVQNFCETQGVREPIRVLLQSVTALQEKAAAVR
jgi:response regulator RpfG family c-di-GMP phosphodiesterase